MVTYDGRNSPIMLDESLNTCSHEVTPQTENVISPLQVYDHQTWEVGNLEWEEPTSGVTWDSDMVMCGHVTN